jgi:hypothetical protein
LLEGDKSFDRPGVRADLPHGVQVQFEMAAITRAGSVVGLFAQDNLVDQSCSVRVGRWQPWQMYAGQLPLQALGQGHEVPHGKDVTFHKAAQQVN